LRRKYRQPTVYLDFVAANKLQNQGFIAWRFLPGMSFGEDCAWWGRQDNRPSSHEGLDFRCFVDSQGRTIPLAEGMLVPVAEEGDIRQIFNDFLGQSVLIAHDLCGNGRRLYSIYAHIKAVDTCRLGEHVLAGQIIGSIAYGRCRTAAAGSGQVPAHLHLSYLWLPLSFQKTFDWRTAHLDQEIIFIDPAECLSHSLRACK